MALDYSLKLILLPQSTMIKAFKDLKSLLNTAQACKWQVKKLPENFSA